MSRWSIVEQTVRTPQGEEQVPVKFGNNVPSKNKYGQVDFIPLKPHQGWISVHLGFRHNTGTSVCKVVYVPRSDTWSFHHPTGQELVLHQGKVDNPLNSSTKDRPNKKRFNRRESCLAYVTKKAGQALADEVFSLIDGLFEEMQEKFKEPALAA